MYVKSVYRLFRGVYLKENSDSRVYLCTHKLKSEKSRSGGQMKKRMIVSLQSLSFLFNIL